MLVKTNPKGNVCFQDLEKSAVLFNYGAFLTAVAVRHGKKQSDFLYDVRLLGGSQNWRNKNKKSSNHLTLRRSFLSKICQ